MSAAAATAEPAEADAVPVKRSKKKLIIVVAVVLLVLLAGGAGAAIFLKKRAAHAAEAAEAAGEGKTEAVAKADPTQAPTYLPLDPFVVNLADKDADRFAQIGITLEVESAGFADQIKTYMPGIRSAILMIIAHKTSRELLERAGKEQLADEIQREAVRPMGIEIPPAALRTVSTADERASGAAPARREAASGAAAGASAAASAPKRRVAAPPNPVRHVHFSSFIIQ